MLRANSAKVEWSPEKKQWHVEIIVGAEVIKRWSNGQPHEAGDDSLKNLAVATAKDEGYDLDPSQVTVNR